jgi:hypothetical protein
VDFGEEHAARSIASGLPSRREAPHRAAATRSSLRAKAATARVIPAATSSW